MRSKVKNMKKKSESRIVLVFRRIFNVRSWSDWDRLKSFTAYIGSGVKRLFVPMKETEVDSFDEALQKFHVSEDDLTTKQKALFRLCLIMLGMAFLIFIYAGYHLFYGTYKAAIISYVVMMIALALAFRYHFWYFQMKTRRLGCTFGQWWRQGIMGEKE